MAVWKYCCLSAKCRGPDYLQGRENFLGPTVEVPADGGPPQCHRCGARPPLVARIFRVHFLVHDNWNGPIIGMHSERFHVACKPNAPALRGAPSTGDPTCVLCPDCKATREWREAMTAWECGRSGGMIVGPTDELPEELESGIAIPPSVAATMLWQKSMKPIEER